MKGANLNRNVTIKNAWVRKNFFVFLKKNVPSLVKQVLYKNKEIIIKTTRRNLLALLSFLNKHLLLQFKVLTDIVVYDRPSFKFRFTVIYNLLSEELNSRILVCTSTNEVLPLESVTNVFKAAGWFEREVYDMFGIFFINHPDLRRILTDYGFTHHPLRKDFPVIGYKEVWYNEKEKRLIYTNVEMNQAYRVFYFKNPWIGRKKHR